MDNKKYYKVVAKCGHVGRRFYVPIQFAVIAENGREAAKRVRHYPRVKHQHKDAILLVKEVSYEEFLVIKDINDNDLYLHCHSKQEQDLLCNMEMRMVEDPHYIKPVKHDKNARKERIEFKKKKLKYLMNINWWDDEYAY